MKVLLNEDIIVKISATAPTEVGSIPKKVGLERLRYDGKKVVDLLDLKTIYVRKENGGFSLHAIPVKNSQAVSMTYKDRKNLTVDTDGTIRILSTKEIADKQIEEEESILKNKLRRTLKKSLGDSNDQLASISKLLFLILDYMITNDATILSALQEINNKTKDIYPKDKTKTELINMGEVLKQELPSYYTKKTSITNK